MQTPKFFRHDLSVYAARLASSCSSVPLCKDKKTVIMPSRAEDPVNACEEQSISITCPRH